MVRSFILLLISFFVFFSSLYCQDKVVAYTTQNKTYFSIPEGTDKSLITNLDLARMDVKEEAVSKETFVSGTDLAIKTIIRNLDTPESLVDREYGVEITILNSDGVELYNYYGKQIYSAAHENPGESEFYTLTEELYNDYGFYNRLFDMDINEISKQFLNEGYSVKYSQKENIFNASNDLMQLIINFDNLYYETYFFENQELKYIDYKSYIKDGDYITPYKESFGYFEYMVNGIPMLRTSEKTYMEYSVIENDKVLYERYDTVKPKSGEIKLHEYPDMETGNNHLKVYPNPAGDIITVEIPFSGENMNIEISDIQGNTVLSKNNAGSGNLTLNISHLPAGTYILYCKSAGSIQSVKFIKN